MRIWSMRMVDLSGLQETEDEGCLSQVYINITIYGHVLPGSDKLSDPHIHRYLHKIL
jgi:hypothetical protein